MLDLGLLAFPIFATASAVWAGLRDSSGRRRSWLALAGGLGAWTIGRIVSTFYESLPADAALLLFAVGAGAALLWFPASQDPTPRARLSLDATIVAGSLFVVSWISVLGTVYRTDADTRVAYGLAVASPVADVVIATIAILVWVRARTTQRRTLGLLSVGIISMALVDSAIALASARGDQHIDGWIDLGCVVAFGVLGIAALSSGAETVSEEPVALPTQARIWVPYVPLLVAAGIGVGALWQSVTSGPLRAVAVLLLVAVMVRQFVVLAENRRLLQTVARQTLRDRLTGLASRTLFLDRLDQAVQRQRMELIPLTVLRLDLDDFESVTNGLGHAAGEEVLIRVAERLTGCLTSTDTLARFEGVEFAALIEGPVEDALVAADRVLEAFTRTFVFDGAALSIRPNIGLTVATAAAANTTTASLLEQAEVALTAAKNAGGGCLRTFVSSPPLPLAARVPVPATHVAAGPESTASTSEPPRPVLASWVTSPSRFTRGVPIMLGLLLIGVLVYGISTQVREDAGRNALFDSWLFNGLMLFAAVLVAARAWLISSERAAWWLVSAGMATSALGDVVLSVWVPEGQSPSIADPFYLAFYPLVYAGLALLLRSRLRRLPMAIWLDSATAGLALAAIAAAIAYGPIHAATVGTPFTVIVGLAYSMGALLLLALAVGALAVLGWRAEQRWGLLVAGFMMYAVADTTYLFATAEGTYTEGSATDTLWPAASLLVAVASWRATPRRQPAPLPGPATWAPPLFCTATALTLLLLDHDSPLPRLAVVLAALTLVAVAARFVVTLREVTALADSHRQAMTDDLTTLANRRAMATALTAAAFEYTAKDADDELTGPGLLLIDLDHFKDINDALGHHVGDQLLCQVADRLAQSVRPSHLLARLGGDEFAILLPAGSDLTSARSQADRLIVALHQPFDLNEMAVHVEASIGIALCPQHCTHPEELLQRADAAMYLAKRTPTRVAVYDSVEDPHRTDDKQTVEELRIAITAGELTCHYQPKVSADGRVHGVEALVRWNHPVRGLLVPDQFLALAEQGGLMRPLATTVLDLALSQARTWHEQGKDLTVAVNLSVTNLLDVDLVTDIGRLLHTHQVPAHTLILEITESVLSTDSLRSHSVVVGLRRLGIGLSIDDYGTGWSSLARLQDMDVDELKLDQVFVAHLSEDPRSIAIVRSTVALAHSLGASLVAEGVEDEATLEALRRYGCDITQGYFHSPPLPADELDLWLSRQSART